jgi:uncharacterized C2H2 Zn-finger protein
MKCPYCEREYESQDSLNGHINANHWKKVKGETK